jgi:hypothetical protein
MTKIIIYFAALLLVVIAKVSFDGYYIIKNGTLGKKVKVIVTTAGMILLASLSIYLLGVRGLLLWPMSITGYSLLFNLIYGIVMHGNPLYMSETTWPDKQLLVLFNNGFIYCLSMAIATLVFGGLINYI